MSPPRRNIFCGDAERRPTTNGRDRKLVGRDSVEPEGCLDLIIHYCAWSSRTPNAFRGEGSHERGLTRKGACVPARILARSLAYARDDSKGNKQDFSTSLGMTAELSACAA